MEIAISQVVAEFIVALVDYTEPTEMAENTGKECRKNGST